MVPPGRPISGLPPFHAAANHSPVLSQQFAPAGAGGMLLGLGGSLLFGRSDDLGRSPQSAIGPVLSGGHLLLSVQSSVLVARGHGRSFGLFPQGQKIGAGSETPLSQRTSQTSLDAAGNSREVRALPSGPRCPNNVVW